MEEVLQREIKNGELKIPKEKRKFLTYPSQGLCDCTLEEREDGIALIFDSAGKTPAESIIEKPLADRLHFLVNAAVLESLHKDYSFSLAPDNLMVDINLCPHVLSRDLNTGGEPFVQKYKALAGEILNPKYSYADYLNGGEDLYKKQKQLTQIAECETGAEVCGLLRAEYEEVTRNCAKTKKLVSKNSVIISWALIPILGIGLIVAALLAVRANFIDIPHKARIIEASQAYIAREYIAVQTALGDVELSEMTHETKHLLARAYVITEALTDEQKNHVLMGLTLMTDSALFDFWIYLGRLNFEASIEIAQRFGDSQLLLFAYMKQRTFIESGNTVVGEEREAILGHLEREISRLQSERIIEPEEIQEDDG